MGIEEETPTVPEGPGRQSTIWAWCHAHPRRRLRSVTRNPPTLYGSDMVLAHDAAPERPASNPMPVEEIYKDSIPRKKGQPK